MEEEVAGSGSRVEFHQQAAPADIPLPHSGNPLLFELDPISGNVDVINLSLYQVTIEARNS
jgi:hypothetical protein